MPRSLVNVSRTKPVAVLTTLTVAAGRTAPLESVTLPIREPYKVCAPAAGVTFIHTNTTETHADMRSLFLSCCLFLVVYPQAECRRKLPMRFIGIYREFYLDDRLRC